MADEPLTLEVFLDRLDIGEYDKHLKEILDRANARYVELLNRRARDLRVGDKLRFRDTTNPKYLRGKVVEFIEDDLATSRRRGAPWAVVSAPHDRSYRRFAGQTFKSPVNTLEKVTE